MPLGGGKGSDKGVVERSGRSLANGDGRGDSLFVERRDVTAVEPCGEVLSRPVEVR